MDKKPGGGFYISKGGQQIGSVGKHNGCVIEIASDGRSMRMVAEGFRNPYVCVDPLSGLITCSDQEGNFIPTTPVHVVRDGGWYGFEKALKRPEGKLVEEPPCWIPHAVCPSGVGQVWAHTEALGPLKGRLLFLDYNLPCVMQVFLDDLKNPRTRRHASITVEVSGPVAERPDEPQRREAVCRGIPDLGKFRTKRSRILSGALCRR